MKHVTLLVLLAGCPLPTGVVIGDLSQPVVAEPLFSDGISMLMPITDGVALPLMPPPQGGYVNYVAARVRNIHSIVQLTGRLREPSNGNEVAFDSRTPTLHLASDGWGYPDAADTGNVANINTCPDYLANDHVNLPYTLEIEITDRTNRTIKLTQTVVPTCQHSDPALQADCVCTCSAMFFPGKCANLSGDGGTR